MEKHLNLEQLKELKTETKVPEMRL